MDGYKALVATDLVQVAASLPDEKYWPAAQFAAGGSGSPSLSRLGVTDLPEASWTVSGNVSSPLARLDVQATE